MSEDGPFDPEPPNLYKGLEKQGKQCATSGLTVGSDEEEGSIKQDKRKGKERKGKERKGKERKGKDKGLEILYQMVRSQRVTVTCVHMYICIYLYIIYIFICIYNAHRYSFF